MFSRESRNSVVYAKIFSVKLFYLFLKNYSSSAIISKKFSSNITVKVSMYFSPHTTQCPQIHIKLTQFEGNDSRMLLLKYLLLSKTKT